MTDFLDTLGMDAVGTIDSGYYRNFNAIDQSKISLKQAIQNCQKNAVITEIKAASPSAGTIRENIDSCAIAQAMQRGGAVGISVLTEPKHFNGSLFRLSQVRAAVESADINEGHNYCCRPDRGCCADRCKCGVVDCSSF